MNNMFKVVLGAGVLLLSSQAFAIPLTGQIVLTGAGMYYDSDSDGVAEGIDIVTATDVANTGWGTAGEVTVAFGTDGTFASLFTVGTTTGIMSDIDFSATSILPLWEVGSLSFDLVSFTSGPVASGYEIVGRGMITDSTGTYSDTTGEFTMNTSSTGSRFSFDATTVPEPAGIALFGMGLLVMGLTSTARRRNNI